MKIIVDSALNASILEGVYPEYAENLFVKSSPDLALQWTAEWVIRGEKALAVLDADSIDPVVQEDARRSALRILRRIVPSDGYDLFMAMPALAARIFEHSAVVESLREGAVIDLIEGQHFAPKASLRRLMGDRDVTKALTALPDDLRKSLREDVQFRDIRRKAEGMRERAIA